MQMVNVTCGVSWAAVELRAPNTVRRSFDIVYSTLQNQKIIEILAQPI